jgi:Uma2 family endonuclease
MNLPLSTDVTGNLSAPPAPPDTQPNVQNLVTEDDTPVDGIYSEKQMRLLTEPLYQSWAKLIHPRTFVATANVGMFYSIDEPPLVPDVLLSLDVRVANELAQKVNRSYFFWKFGKSPEVIVEIVSNLEGEELGKKKAIYARIGILYYIVWDPFHFLGSDQLHCFLLAEKIYKKNGPWFPAVGLGIKEWTGTFEGNTENWLRWCDQQGQLIPTGGEAAEQERLRANQESQRAERLASQLRAHGIEPAAP